MRTYLLFMISNARWLGGGFLLTMFSSFGQTFFISLSTGDIRKSFELTSGEYGSIYMVATLASALSLTFLGRIVDHYSILQTAVFSIVMLALACILLGYSPSLLMLVLALYGLRLFGQGMMSHIAVTAMGRWYAVNRGKAVSIVSIGFNAGLAIFPVVYIALIGVVGWRNAWLIAAGALVIFALPCVVLLLRQNRSAQGTSAPSDNFEEKQIGVQRQWTMAQMLRDPYFWMTTMFLLGPPFISTAIFFHQDFLFAQREWSTNLFAWTFVMMTIVSIVSGLLSGIIADKFSATLLLPMFLVPLGIGCLALASVENAFALVSYMALLGVSMGVNATIYGSIWPEIYGVANLGAIRSIVTALMVFSSALGPGVMGWAIDFGVSLSVQYWTMVAFCGVGTLVLLISSRHYHKR